MKWLTRSFLPLLLALLLCSAGFAEQVTDGGAASADDTGKELTAQSELYLLVSNAGTDTLLGGAGQTEVQIAAALIMNALEESDVLITVAGTEPDTEAVSVHSGQADAMAAVSAAIEQMGAGSKDTASTNMRGSLDGLAGLYSTEKPDVDTLVVMLNSGAIYTDKESFYSNNMKHAGQMKTDSFEVLFCGVDADEAFSTAFIPMVSGGLYAETEYMDIRTDADETGKAAVQLANAVLDRLGMTGYERYALAEGSASIGEAGRLLKNALFMYPASADNEQIDGEAASSEASAEPSAEASAEPTAEASAEPTAEESAEPEQESAEVPVTVQCGEWELTDAARGQDAVTVYGRKREIVLEVTTNAQYELGNEIEWTVLATVDGEPLNPGDIAYELSGKSFVPVDGKIPGELVGTVGSYWLNATVKYWDIGISVSNGMGFKVIGAPVWAGDDEEATVLDVPEKPGMYVCFTDVKSLFEDPNGEGIESVTFELDDPLKTRFECIWEEDTLILKGDVADEQGEKVTGRLIAINQAKLSAEKEVAVTLYSVPKLISSLKLDLTNEVSDVFDPGEAIELDLEMNKVNLLLLQNMPGAEAWSDYIKVFCAVDGGEMTELEGSLSEGWSYKGTASEPGALKAWLHAGSENVDSSLPAAFELEWTIAAPATVEPSEAPVVETPTADDEEELDPTMLLILVGCGAGLILIIVLICVLALRPRFVGYLKVSVESGDMYQGTPISMDVWGKKAITFGKIVGQTGLPPISALAIPEVMNKLVFKPVKGGIQVISKTGRLEGIGKSAVLKSNKEPVEFRIAQTNVKIIFSYARQNF